MPQLPNSSTEDLGADDEVKEYKQEDGEESENGPHLDLVNDIKSDLIKKETENSEVSVFFHFLLSCWNRFCQDELFLQSSFNFYCAARNGLGASVLVGLKRRASKSHYRIILFGKIVNKLLFFLPKGICRHNSLPCYPLKAQSLVLLMRNRSYFANAFLYRVCYLFRF